MVAEKVSAMSAHELHWGLQESPFRNSLDPRFFYESPSHEEALARLNFLVENSRRQALLLGASGSGKSLLLELFANGLRRGGTAIAKIDLLGVDTHELLWSLVSQLGMNPPLDAARFALWRDFSDRLAELRYQQLPLVILLDNADQASTGVLTCVQRLVQIDPSPDAQQTVVLTANNTNYARIGQPLLEMSDLRIEIEPWESAETQSYLSASIAKAGRLDPLFDELAVNRLHELAGGLPRRVCQLAELALVAGAGQQLNRIDEQTVQSVYDELSVVSLQE